MNVQELSDLNACHDAIEWAITQPDWETLWDNCERGDWMLWLIEKTIAGEPGSNERKPLVLAACECARLALPYVRKDDHRPLKAIETAEAWARDDTSVSLQDVRAAAYAAYSVAAAAVYAYSAAAAAVYAAYAAADAAYSAAAAAVYAADAAAVDAAVDADAARKKTRQECAEIVRKYYSVCPMLINKEEKK